MPFSFSTATGGTPIVPDVVLQASRLRELPVRVAPSQASKARTPKEACARDLSSGHTSADRALSGMRAKYTTVRITCLLVQQAG